MDLRPLTPDYAVSPQIRPEDMAAIAEAGYRTVICNRPDAEVTPDLATDRMRAAAEAAGLRFVVNTVDHSGIGPDTVPTQEAAMEDGPTLAYCRSGTRCTVVWLLARAPEEPPDRLLAAAREAGYDLDGLRPQLEALHKG